MADADTPETARGWMDEAEELAGIGFWRMDPATGAVEWSRNMFALFEFPLGEAPRAEETMSRVHPDDVATAYVDLSANLREGGHVSISRIMLPSGGVRVVESRTQVQRDNAGEAVMLVGSVQDITARIEHERQLVKARNLAEQKLNEESTYAANASHELRTPLMAIIGYAHLLAQRSDLPPDAAREVRLLAQSANTLLSVSNSVLGRSSAAAVLKDVDRAPVSVTLLVAQVIDLFAAQARTKGIQLHHRSGAGFPAHIEAHADALTQILVNLVGNAVKFTDRGSVTILSDYDERLQNLNLVVEDTGSGFDETTRKALFGRFARGADRRQLPGVGLGLSICKGLVEALDGAIDVSSTPGVGSRFTVTLPARCAAPPLTAPDAGKGSPRVLVIDDHPAILEITNRVLAAAGAHVTCAADGASGLQLAQAQAFDLILVDLNLPDMTGQDVAGRIRGEAGPNCATRLIAYTAADVDVAALQAAFDGCIGKPIDPRRLVTLLFAAGPLNLQS